MRIAHAVPSEATIAGSSAVPTALIRRRIQNELPPDVFKPRPARALIMLSIAAGIIIVSTLIVVMPVVGWASFFLSISCGFLYASLFFLGHEAGHGSIIRTRALQDLMMQAAFLIFLLSPALWRVWHNRVHHGHTNSDTHDPDNFGTLSSYLEFRSVRILAALTPGSGRLLGVAYLPVWFTVHSQLVLWFQSRRCAGFEPLSRKRAALETAATVAFWTSVSVHLGPLLSLFVILIPMMVANTILMLYIATNHLLMPPSRRADPLASSMSVTTHWWLDLIHFNFSHHVEHHLFPSMSSKHAPRVRQKLHEYANDRFLAPPHLAALRLVFRTPRIHDRDGALVDPITCHRVSFDDIAQSLRASSPYTAPADVEGGCR